MLPYSFMRVPQCRCCHAFATGDCLMSGNGNEWICACCSTTNRFMDFPGFERTLQAREGVYDVYFERKQGEVKTSVNFSALRIVLAVEKSEATVSSGFFRAALNKARKLARTCSCPITVVVFDKFVQIPVFSSDGKHFSLVRLLEPDHRSMPRARTVFCAMPQDLELFESYLDVIEHDAAITKASLDLASVIDSLGSLLVNDSVGMIYSCQTRIGDFSALSEKFVTKWMSVSMTILKYMNTDVDTSALSQFIMATNSKLRVIGVE